MPLDLFRIPATAQAPASGRLLLGDDDRPVRRASRGQLERDVVRRIGAKIVDDAVADFVVAEFGTNQAGRQNVGKLSAVDSRSTDGP